MHPWTWIAALGALLPGLPQAEPGKKGGVEISSQVPRYELRLPPGYDHSVPRGSPPRFVRSCGREDWAKITAVLAQGPEPLRQNPSGSTAEDALPYVSLPPDAKHLFYTVKWKDLDIPVVEHRAVVNNLPIIGISAVVPLRAHALTITVSAPDPLEKELREDFKEILARLDKTSSNWYTPEELRKMALLDTAGYAGAGLLLLYPIAWLLFFRGDAMRAHGVRVAWLLGAALLLFMPITSPGPTTLINNLVVNAILPLALISFVARRIKLGLDLD